MSPEERKAKPLPPLQVEFRQFSPFAGGWWEEPQCPRPGCEQKMERIPTQFVQPGPPDVLCPDHGNEGMSFVVIESPDPNIRGWFTIKDTP